MDVQIDVEEAVVLPSLWLEGLTNLFIDAVSLLNNKRQIDSQERIKNANKTYFMLQKFFRNKTMSKKPKLRLRAQE
jgi:hypothetical protein